MKCRRCFVRGFFWFLLHFGFVGKDLTGSSVLLSLGQIVKIFCYPPEKDKSFLRDALKLFSVYSLKYLA